MSGNLVELAERFVCLSGELDATRDAMRRLLLNGAGGANANPTPAKRPGALTLNPATVLVRPTAAGGILTWASKVIDLVIPCKVKLPLI